MKARQRSFFVILGESVILRLQFHSQGVLYYSFDLFSGLLLELIRSGIHYDNADPCYPAFRSDAPRS
jgi:hypothetical protein